ncbi:hypothetical protein ACFPK9_09895 [Rubritalea spongiae]|uniref:Outer membrane protein beta-barrel domain-containing protein n=1 Tax=Rubritalea spongiae TaxID=430797 RepID=A0ABW5DZ25_9BACT
MNKPLIAAAALTTTTICVQAQDDNQVDSFNLYGAYSAGYLFETEEALHTLRLGVEHVSTFYYLQLGTYSVDLPSDSDLESFTVSAGVTGRREFAKNFVGYIGGSLGILNAEGSESHSKDDDTVFYADAAAGFELLVSENVSFNTGIRGVYAEDANIFDYQGGVYGADGLDESFDIAVELGIIVRF